MEWGAYVSPSSVRVTAGLELTPALRLHVVDEAGEPVGEASMACTIEISPMATAAQMDVFVAFKNQKGTVDSIAGIATWDSLEVHARVQETTTFDADVVCTREDRVVRVPLPIVVDGCAPGESNPTGSACNRCPEGSFDFAAGRLSCEDCPTEGAYCGK